MSNKPHFICVAPPKTGTTWLYVNLQKHPAIWLPPIKEISYFYYRQELGENINWRDIFRLNHWLKDRHRSLLKRRFQLHKEQLLQGKWRFEAVRWDWKYLLGRQSDDWYLSLFDADFICGDISPMYCNLDETSIQNVKALLPQTKIIIGLRDPIARAWSHVRMSLQADKQAQKTDFLSSVEGIAYVKNLINSSVNDYVTLVKKWKKQFGESHVFIYFFDEIKTHPQQLMDKLCEFLAIELFISPQLSQQINLGKKQAMPLAIQEILIRENMPYIESMIDEFDSIYPREWKQKYV